MVMSGGSYEYLCYKEIEELRYNEDLIQRIINDLESLGYANDVAKDTKEFFATLKNNFDKLDMIKEKLSPIWKALEWWKSCDTNEDSFKRALEKYRNDKR